MVCGGCAPIACVLEDEATSVVELRIQTVQLAFAMATVFSISAGQDGLLTSIAKVLTK